MIGTIRQLLADCELIDGLAAKATDRPWHADGASGCDTVRCSDNIEVCFVSGRHAEYGPDPDAALIVALRNSGPRIARALRSALVESEDSASTVLSVLRAAERGAEAPVSPSPDCVTRWTRKYVEAMVPTDRVDFIRDISEGFCRHCGRDTDEWGCSCANDE